MQDAMLTVDRGTAPESERANREDIAWAREHLKEPYEFWAWLKTRDGDWTARCGNPWYCPLAEFLFQKRGKVFRVMGGWYGWSAQFIARVDHEYPARITRDQAIRKLEDIMIKRFEGR